MFLCLGDGNFSLRVFTAQDGRKSAIASPFCSDVKKIVELLQGLKCGKQTLRFKSVIAVPNNHAIKSNQNILVEIPLNLQDRGDERNEFGQFVNPLPAFERRKLQHLFSNTPRKVKLFHSTFTACFDGVFDFQTPKTFVYLVR